MTLRAAVMTGLMLATSLSAAAPASAETKAIARYNDWRVYT